MQPQCKNHAKSVPHLVSRGHGSRPDDRHTRSWRPPGAPHGPQSHPEHLKGANPYPGHGGRAPNAPIAILGPAPASRCRLPRIHQARTRTGNDLEQHQCPTCAARSASASSCPRVCTYRDHSRALALALTAMRRDRSTSTATDVQLRRLGALRADEPGRASHRVIVSQMSLSLPSRASARKRTDTERETNTETICREHRRSLLVTVRSPEP